MAALAAQKDSVEIRAQNRFSRESSLFLYGALGQLSVATLLVYPAGDTATLISILEWNFQAARSAARRRKRAGVRATHGSGPAFYSFLSGFNFACHQSVISGSGRPLPGMRSITSTDHHKDRWRKLVRRNVSSFIFHSAIDVSWGPRHLHARSR
ncbi:MAG TPA: hypothetical protein VGJ21_22660, partial [Terracidiphilus sp.]